MSCNEVSKDELVKKEGIQKENVIPPKVSNMVRFSEILSKAVAKNSDLRSFLKTEALKMMDKDFDIFYPLSKNEIVSNGKSFRDILAEYAENKEELTGIEKTLSLLTIYVPELPSGFDANIWDAENEIPYVASVVLRNDSTDFYYDGTVALSIKSSEIPGWPTLVVKNNERIRLKDKNAAPTALRSSSNNDAYEFIDEAFDGQSPSLRALLLPPILPPLVDPPLPPIVPYNPNLTLQTLYPTQYAAYNEMGLDNNYWQRDYIYYGLTKQSGSTGSGSLNRRFSERIVSMEFSPDAYLKMSDQAGDPSWIETLKVSGNPPAGSLFWTEGKFEIKIDVFFNNLSGLGPTIPIYFSVNPTDIFDVTYSKSDPIMLGLCIYQPTGLKSKDYNPNIDIITWDLENNSFGWKFNISEIDDQITETQTVTVSAEYATNFGLTAGGQQEKIGLNFGTSAKRTQTNTYSIATTKGSDDLGSITYYFSDPVIQSVSSNNYTLFSRSNPYVKMSIIPVQLY